MADLGTLRPGAGNTTGLPTTGSVIGNPGASTALSDDSDATFDGQNTNTSGTYQYGRELGNPPTDFGSMTTCSVQLRRAWQSAPTNSTWDTLDARIMASDGTTVLAAADSGGTFKTVSSSITAATPGNSSVVAFDYVNTGASKTQWDGALIQTQWVRTRSKGGDALGCRVYEAFITGTYALANAALTGSTAQVFANTGALLGKGALAGTTPQVFANTGALVASAALAGTATQAFSNAGAATALGALTGTAALVFANTGTVSEAPEIVQLRPDSTVADNGWLTHLGGTDLHTVLDEAAADDDDYIQSPAHASAVEFVVSLQNPASGTVLQPVNVRYRYKKDNDEFTVNLRMRLMEGATEIAAWDHSDIGTTIAQATQTLTTPQFNAVTDWNDVRLSGIANPA